MAEMSPTRLLQVSALVCALCSVCVVSLCSPPDASFAGRWDIESEGSAWWLEVKETGAERASIKLIAGNLGIGGGLELPDATVRNGELQFSQERAYRVAAGGERRRMKALWRAKLIDDQLRGTLEFEGQTIPPIHWTGRRSPVIRETDDGSWRESKPIPLFNGKDLRGWGPARAGQACAWSVQNGILLNEPRTCNLMSTERFWNFVLFAEYRLREGASSGIGLRSRYEVQVWYDVGQPPTVQSHGALYGQIAPTVNATRPAGEWQSMTVRLVGMQVTVTLNGIKIIDRQQIEHPTPFSVEPFQGQAGPIAIQGDHGAVEFRKIVVIPLVKGR